MYEYITKKFHITPLIVLTKMDEYCKNKDNFKNNTPPTSLTNFIKNT